MSRFPLTFIILLAPGLLFSEVPDKAKDIPGSRDHAALARPPGSTIAGYRVQKKGQYLFPAGPLNNGAPGKTLTLTGTVTRITYESAGSRATAEIFQGFEQRLRDAGFEAVFSASGLDLARQSEWVDAFYGDIYSLQGETKHQRFLSARRASPAGDIYVALYVTLGWYRYPVIQADIVETRPAKPLAAGKRTPAR